MAKERISWSDNAKADFKRIVTYLEEEWSPEMAIKFVEIFYQKLDLIEGFPEIGRISVQRPDIRRFPVSKHNVLYYQLVTDEIVLINIFDTRQNPDANPYEP